MGLAVRSPLPIYLPARKPPEEGLTMSVTLDRVSGTVRHRRDFASLPEALPLPDLIQTQLDSFKWFCDERLQELSRAISPIQPVAAKNRDRTFIGSESG